MNDNNTVLLLKASKDGHLDPYVEVKQSKAENRSVSVRAAAAEILLPKSGSAADFSSALS